MRDALPFYLQTDPKTSSPSHSRLSTLISERVPANRIGYEHFTLSQLQVIQEVITMVVFAGFAILYMREPVKLDFLYAALCLVGAVYFVFRQA